MVDSYTPADKPRITPMPAPLAMPASRAFRAQGSSETCFALYIFYASNQHFYKEFGRKFILQRSRVVNSLLMEVNSRANLWFETVNPWSPSRFVQR